MTTIDFAARARAVGLRLGVLRAFRLPHPWVGPVLVGYGLPVVAAVGAALTWFRPGGFVASGDVTPFVRDNLADELLSPWNHQLTGAGSSSYEIARALEVGALRLADLVGASDVAGQFLLFAACFAFAAFGAAYLAAGLVRHPAAVAVAGLLGAFNAFTLVNHPNPLPLVAGGVIGLLVGQLWRRARGRRVSAVAVAASTLPASYVALNPPLLVVVALSVALGAAGANLFAGPGGSRRALGLLIRATPLAVLLNAWWIVPLAQATLDGAGFAFTAETDVRAWAWSHVRNSLANVASLNAHWGWTHPEYFPYAEQLESGLWPFLRWLLPVGALAGIAVAGRRLRAGTAALGLAAATLIFLGKGLHGPFAEANAWLYEQVPGFWLLREPASKLGVALVLAYVVLTAVACDRALATLAARRRAVRRAGAVALAVVVGGALAYPWPLWTGAVVPGDRGILPGGHVRMPDEWRAAAAAVNRSPVRGKALVLPLSRYYQVTTTWGYHGADAVPQQLLTRPVLRRLPGGYFGNSPGVEALLAGIEDAALLGDAATAKRLLHALGVSHVLVRRDLVSDTQTPAYADPDRLRSALARLPDARHVVASPVVDVFELADADGLVRAYARLVGIGTEDLGLSVGTLPADAVAARRRPITVDAVRWTVSTRQASSSFRLARPGLYSVGRATSETGLYHVRVIRAGSRSALEIRDTARITIDGGAPLPALRLRVPLERPDVRAIEVEDRLLPLKGAGDFLSLEGVDELRAYAAVGERSVLGAFSPLEDCNAHDGRTPKEAGLSLDRERGIIRLAARAHSACTWARVERTSPSAAFELRVDYRVAHGAPARVCAWQDGPDRCVALPTLPEREGWRTYRAVFRRPAEADALRLYLYADGDVPGGSMVEYRDVQLLPLEPASRVARLLPGDTSGAFVPLPAGPHELRVAQDLPARPLGPLSKLEDCGASDVRTPAEAGLRLDRLPGGVVELAARAHVGCAWLSAGKADSGAIYRVSFEHRTLSGRPPRACVWQIAVQRCAELPEVVAGSDWSRFAATFRPDPGASELRLYLYADGDDSGTETRVQYRDLALEPVAPATIGLEPVAEDPASSPTVTWAEERPDRYRVDVQKATGSFVLGLAESFASGWSLGGLPRGWTAEHVEVDGYANGWRIDGRGSASLTLDYEPAARARLAATASVVAAIGCAVFVAFVALRRRRGRLLRAVRLPGR